MGAVDMTWKADALRDDALLSLYDEYRRTVLEPVIIRNDIRSGDLLVVSVMRDEIALAKEFLRHYRGAGVQRFAIIDNNSSDGTFDYLCRQPDVDVYRAATDFTTARKQAWLTMLVDLYRKEGQWFLHADADEHIVFDGLEFGLTFADLAAAMDRQGIRRARGCLVDMYAADDGQARDSENEFLPLQLAYPCFDGEGYREYHLTELIAREGGPRQRLFGAVSERFRPQLTKYPLFRPESGCVFVNPHFLWPYPGNFRSACFLGILHFKFLPDFERKVEKAVEEGNYWQDSLEYRCYQSVISQTGRLSLADKCTHVYQGPASLLRCQIIAPVPW
ncbi:glycosyltransferase family 2 protein [Ciceribacter ferrooxidans]|nr:glycosyltransferase family 2 protein [Ciceribacter ferrooxidans]